MEHFGSGEEQVRRTFEELSNQVPVEPGTDPRREGAERFEDSEIGQATQAYEDALNDARQAGTANDN